jgi:DNA invertase Pin-like site-specific DNA recombinase
MLHSLAAQVSYYSDYIQRNPAWSYVGVYADEAKTGTKDSRPEFQRLLADCRAGKVQVVITKSISRFARNTVDLLAAVRELKALGVDVFFEEQNIRTLSAEGEMMITILAGYAQEESLSVSENIKWRKRHDMEAGRTKPVKVYGYRVEDGKLVIVPEQAEIVRSMYDDCLSGLGCTAIANRLNAAGVPGPTGGKWCGGVVLDLLHNEKLTGVLKLQKTFVEDHLTKRTVINRGELPMYIIRDAHEPIISEDVFDTVQAELTRRHGIGTVHESEGVAFRKKLVCEICGRKFHHTSNGRAPTKYRAWICGGRDKRTGTNCTALTIPEPTLMKAAAEALGLDAFDGDAFSERVDHSIVRAERRLTFIYKDGTERDVLWEKRKSWPYSVIGFEKRIGRNICYSKCGKGNMSERRRKKLERERKESESNG